MFNEALNILVHDVKLIVLGTLNREAVSNTFLRPIKKNPANKFVFVKCIFDTINQIYNDMAVENFSLKPSCLR